MKTCEECHHTVVYPSNYLPCKGIDRAHRERNMREISEKDTSQSPSTIYPSEVQGALRVITFGLMTESVATAIRDFDVALMEDLLFGT